MSLPGSVLPQLVVNGVLVLGVLAYLPRALRNHRFRAPAVAVLALACVGLWLNLHGYSVSGWQEGFRRDRA